MRYFRLLRISHLILICLLRFTALAGTPNLMILPDAADGNSGEEVSYILQPENDFLVVKAPFNPVSSGGNCTITCPSNITQNTSPGACTATVNVGDATFTGDCNASSLTWVMTGATTGSGSGQIGSHTFNKGVTTVTYTILDNDGAPDSCSFTVTVVDNQAPAITCPAGSPFSKYAIAGQCYYIVQGNEFDPNFYDNCPGTSIINNFNSSGTLSNAQIPKGSTAITWTATDAAGLTSTCSITVNVVDNQPPGITCPSGSPFSRNTAGGQCFYIVQGNEFNPAFSDNCPGTSAINNYNNSGTLSGEQIPKGSTTIAWTVTDAAGLTASCSITVNVIDNQPPVLTCPPGSPFNRNTDPGQCVYTVQGTEFNPTFSDNCTGTTILNNFNNSATLANADLPKGSTTVVWTATDAVGSTSTCSITINISDNQPPAINCPAGSPFSRNTIAGNCYYIVQGNEFDPTFSDNCPGTTISNSLNGSGTLSGAQLPKGSSVITWTATDATGLTASCALTVNVNDNQPPVINCPSGSPFLRNTQSGQCYYTVQGTEFNPTFSDNCPGTSILNDFNGSGTLSGAQLPKGSNTIIWTATDASGLTASCTITVHVNDNQPPVITCPPGSPFTRNTDSGQCFYTVQGNELDPTFSDNCPGTTVSNNFNNSASLGGAQLPKGNTNIIWTATDASGLTATCSITVQVIDNQPPAIICPSGNPFNRNTDPGQCYYTVQGTEFNPTCSDNCPGLTVVNNFNSSSTLSNAQLPKGATNITWTVTDASGMTASCAITVTVTDNQPPAITCPAGSPFSRNTVGGQCYYIVQGAEFNPAFSDNCTGTSIINNYNNTNTLSGAQLPKGATVITWIATDAAGLTASCSITVNVIDNQPPAITCPPGSPFSRNTDVGQCYYTVQGDEFNAVFYDNCPGTSLVNDLNNSSTLAGEQLPKGTTTITWTATDASGLTSTCAIAINVADNQSPALSCPAGSPFFRPTDLNQCYYTVQGNEFNATFSDNCPGSTILNNFNNSSTLSGAQLPKGSTAITWTATDAAGLTATCSIIVNVNDNQPPSITCPAGSPFFRMTDPNQCHYTVQGNEFNPVYSDNCTGTTVINSYNNSSTLTGVQLPKGNTDITWTATDASGLTSTCLITIQVFDNQNPVVNCPAGSPFSRNTDAGYCYYTVQGSEFNPTFTDNCPGVTVLNNFNNSSTLANAQLPKGSTTITWQASDASGLTATCSITVNVNDNEPPIITCPSGSPFSRNTIPGQCYYIVQNSEFNPTFSDNCPGTTILNNFNSSSTLAGTQIPKGSNVITWTATDAAGLTSTCSITVNVSDNQPPVITCPAGSPFSRNTISGQCYYVVQGNEFNPTFSDNCTGTTVLNNFNYTGTLTGAQIPKGTNLITWTATDASGLTATCSITVNVIDNQLPVITCPSGSPFFKMTDPDQCYYTVQGSEFNPTYTDNCPGTTILNNFNNNSTLGGAQLPKGSTSIRWTATDASGLTATCLITVQVYDNQPPSITCPPGSPFNRNTDVGKCYYTVQGGEFNPTFSDNCTGSAIWNSFNSSNTLANAQIPKGTTAITWRATDASGLTATCSITVNVIDNQPPGITCPLNQNLNNNPGLCSAVATFTPPVTTDNCPGVTLLQTAGLPSGSAFPVGITTNVFRATDAAGNTSTCSFTITVNDNEKPVINCPPDLGAVCGISEQPPYTTYAQFVAAGGNASDNCSLNTSSFIMLSEVPDGVECPVTVIRTYAINDASGNQDTCQQEIIINDQVPPQLSGIPDDIQVICSTIPAPPPIGTVITATDNCDTDIEIHLIQESTQNFNNTCDAIIYQVFRTWVATDDCGNTDSAMQVIDVICECCTNGIDDDGDGKIDEDDPKCPCSAPQFKLECNELQYYFVPAVWQMNPNYNNDPNLYTSPSSFFITAPFGTAHINVKTADGTTFNQNYTVQNGVPLEIPLTYNLVQTPNYNTVESNRGFVITTDELLQVLYRLTANNNQLHVTIMGDQALGRRFRAGSQTNVCGLPNTEKRENHFISVLAIEDSTLVNFEFTAPMKGLPPTYSVMLDKFETYVVIDNDVNQTVTGSLITSTKDIVVVTGSQHSQQCSGGNGRDGAADMLVPTCVAGTDYVVFRGTDDNNPSTANYAVVTAITSNTEVYLNGGTTPVALLNPGQYYTYNLPTPDFSNRYIKTSEPAYVYQFGSVMTNGEIGMAVCPPIHGCNGDMYCEFKKFPNSTSNIVTIVVSVTGLSSLTLNGNPYTMYATAVTIPGFAAWRTVTFDNADLANFNIVRCNEYIHVAQFNGKTNTGAFGYLTSFKDKISIFEPESGQPTLHYFADSICANDSVLHCVVSSSCAGEHYVSNIVMGANTGGVMIYPDSVCFTYIGKDDFTGMDTITVVISDALGFTQCVCISFYICGEGPLMTCPDSLTLECGIDEIPLPYSSFAEFIAAGGSVTDQCNFVDTSSFRLADETSEIVECMERITRTYEISDYCGNTSTCSHILRIDDTTPPTFDLPDLSDKTCVADIYHAVYNPYGSYEENTDLTYPRPNYFLLQVGDTLLDIRNLNDNCTDPDLLTIEWELDFGNDGTYELSGSGQLSEAPEDYFPVGETMIRYTVTDLCGNETIQSQVLVVWPRPDILDNR